MENSKKLSLPLFVCGGRSPETVDYFRHSAGEIDVTSREGRREGGKEGRKGDGERGQREKCPIFEGREKFCTANPLKFYNVQSIPEQTLL